MYLVQWRVNGTLVDERRGATLAEAWDALEDARRLVRAAGAPIVAEEPRQYLIARDRAGWVSVTIAAAPPARVGR